MDIIRSPQRPEHNRKKAVWPQTPINSIDTQEQISWVLPTQWYKCHNYIEYTSLQLPNLLFIEKFNQELMLITVPNWCTNFLSDAFKQRMTFPADFIKKKEKKRMALAYI